MIFPLQMTLRRIMRACLLTALATHATLALSASAAEQTVVVRTESPRATLESFVQLRDTSEAAIARYWEQQNRTNFRHLLMLTAQFAELLDLSSVPAASRDKVAVLLHGQILRRACWLRDFSGNAVAVRHSEPCHRVQYRTGDARFSDLCLHRPASKAVPEFVLEPGHGSLDQASLIVFGFFLPLTSADAGNVSNVPIALTVDDTVVFAKPCIASRRYHYSGWKMAYVRGVFLYRVVDRCAIVRAISHDRGECAINGSQ